MDKITLKPCPFCGNEPQMIMQEAAGMILCPECKVYKLFTIAVDGVDKAVSVWNARKAE